MKIRKESKPVHFAPLMDLCDLITQICIKKIQEYKGRVVLRGDVVKDDSSLHAVFTEKGSSASHTK